MVCNPWAAYERIPVRSARRAGRSTNNAIGTLGKCRSELDMSSNRFIVLPWIPPICITDCTRAADDRSELDKVTHLAEFQDILPRCREHERG